MRITISQIALFLAIVSVAQNVPNGGFENWETEDYFVVDDWVSYGKPARTTSANSGSYALKLANQTNSDGLYYPSSIYNVDWQGGGVDKFPYDGDPLSMVFDAEYNLFAGDSAQLTSAFFEKGQWIGDATIKVTGSSSGTYLTYSVPITWYSTSRTPDSVYIGMRSLTTETGNGPGYITIDDFRFENIGNRTVEINNYDFENWTNQGVRYPTGWMPIDLVAFEEWGGFLLNPSVVQNQQPFRGQSCLEIRNFQSWNDIAEGFCFTGDTSSDAWRPQFPIDQKYQHLQGYYKLENGGDDSAEISFNVFRAGNYLGEGKIRFGGTTNGWAFFSIPVTYYVDIVPDSATIRAVASINQANNSPNTTLFLDELSFVNTLDNKVGIDENKTTTQKVFPNPFSDNITILGQEGSYTICTLLGEEVIKGKTYSGETSINLNTLQSGVYIIRLTNTSNQQWQKKIIKQ